MIHLELSVRSIDLALFHPIEVNSAVCRILSRTRLKSLGLDRWQHFSRPDNLKTLLNDLVSECLDSDRDRTDFP